MRGTHHVIVGDRGRIVLPAAVRQRAGLSEGSPLILIEAPDGLILLTREQLKTRVRAELAGLDLVKELLSERRAQAESEDAA
jgi:AbrB family looped-hinge helix DNA binding protein